MPRTIAIGDIHGAHKALLQVIDKIALQEDDTLIFLGDLVDGWSGSYDVIEYLLELQQSHNCIFIKGNHDLYCEYWLATGEKNENWELHGGDVTMAGYEGKSEDDKKRHLNFFQQMPYYHIDDKDRLFVHAGFTSMHGPIGENRESNLIWDRTLLETAVATDDRLDITSIRYPRRLVLFEEIYIGHTPTQKFNTNTPLNAANLWDVDTGAAFKGKLSAIDVDTKEVWQSQQVYLLYPKENGRNKI